MSLGLAALGLWEHWVEPQECMIVYVVVARKWVGLGLNFLFRGTPPIT